MLCFHFANENEDIFIFYQLFKEEKIKYFPGLLKMDSVVPSHSGQRSLRL